MKYLIIITSIFILSACAALPEDRELPNNDQPGSDKMKLSPCACNQIEFNPKNNYNWLTS